MQKQLQIIILVVLLTTLGPIAGDIYLPSLPNIAKSYNVDIHVMQLMAFYYTLGFSIGSLIYGSLSDRFGRKGIILICLVIGALGAILCATAPNIPTLLGGRLVQGLSLSCCPVLSRAITRDITKNSLEMAKLSSKVSVLYALLVNSSQFLGGFIQQNWMWRTTFYVLFAYLILIFLLVIYKLPETNLNLTNSKFSVIIRDNLEIVKNKNFLSYNFASAMVLGGLTVYFTSIPGILELGMGLSPEKFGYVTLVLMFARMCAGYLNNRLLDKISLSNTLLISSLIMLASGAGLLLIISYGQLSIFTLLFTGFIFLFGGGITLINAGSMAISIFPHKAGTASSVYGCIQMLGSSCGSLLIVLLPFSPQLKLAWLLLFFAVMCCILSACRQNKTVIAF